MLGPQDTRQTVFGFITDNPDIARNLLREHGCTCKTINLSFSVNRGPRCRNCNTVAIVVTPEFRKKHNLK